MHKCSYVELSTALKCGDSSIKGINVTMNVVYASGTRMDGKRSFQIAVAEVLEDLAGE